MQRVNCAAAKKTCQFLRRRGTSASGKSESVLTFDRSTSERYGAFDMRCRAAPLRDLATSGTISCPVSRTLRISSVARRLITGFSAIDIRHARETHSVDVPLIVLARRLVPRARLSSEKYIYTAVSLLTAISSAIYESDDL